MPDQHEDSRLEHLNRVLRAIRNVNRTITRSQSKDELLQGICDTLIETRGYFNAWILLCDEQRHCVATHQAGLDHDLDCLRGDDACTCMVPCAQKAMQEKTVVQIYDPLTQCHACPLSHSYEGRSGMTAPLIYRGKVMGALNVSIPRVYFGDAEEKDIFGEAADDIAYALHGFDIAAQLDEHVVSLKYQRDFIANLMDTSPVAITVLDTGGRIVQANTRAEQLLGLSRSEIADRTYNAPEWKITDEQGNPFPDEALPFRRVMDSGKPVYEIRHAIEMPDGRCTHLCINAAPLCNDKGAIERVVCSMEDHTELVQTHRELQESEQRHRMLFEQSNDAVFIHDREGIIQSMNKAAQALLGYTAGELKGSAVHNLHPASEMARARTVLNDTWQQGGSRFETQLLTADGSLIDAEISAKVVDTHQGLVQGIVRDITQRKSVEKQNEEYQRLLATTVNAVDSLLMVVDRQCRIVLCNWKDHEWVPEEKRHTRPFCYEVMKHYDAPCPGCPCLKTFEDGQPRWYEDRNPLDDSYKEISVLPICDEQGHVEYVLENVRDVTERKKREQYQQAIARFQSQLLRVSTEQEVYPLVTRKIQEIIQDGIVLATRVDDDGHTIRIVSYYGLDVSMKKVVDTFGMDPVDTEYRLESMEREEVELFKRGSLECIEGGLHVLSFRKIPKPACTIAEKLLRIKKVYVIGFVPGGSHIGGISILARGELTRHKDHIEHIVNLAAISLQRMRAEQQLARREEDLRITLHSIGDAVIATDTQGLVTRMNPVAETLTGYEAGRAIGRPLEEVFAIVNAQTGEKADNPVHKVIQTGVVVGLANHTMLIAADGTRYQIADSGAPIRDSEGRIIGVVLVFRDVTEEYARERMLQESEKKFRDIFNSANDAMYLHTLSSDAMPGRFVEVNDVAVRMLGYSREEFYVMTPLDIDCGPNREEVPQIMKRLSEQRYTRFEVHHRAKNGREIPVEIGAHLVEMAGETRVLSVARDITERKKAEAALRENEQRLNLALEGGGLGTWDWHISSGKVIFNERWATMKGYAPEEIEPYVHSWQELVHPDDYPRAQQKLDAHLRGETPSYEARFRMRHKSGDWVWIADKGKVIERDKNGNPIRACGTHLDITRQKQLQERLQQAQKMEAVGQLAGGIAHDFNNILGAVIGYADMTREMVPSSTRAYKNQEKILQASDRAKNLVRQILSFSRRGEETLETMLLRPVLKEVISLLKASLPASICIHSYLQREKKPVRANPTKIHELLMNCATNAAYAMDEKGDMTFRLYHEQLREARAGLMGDMEPGDYAVIEIEDTGCGIPDQVRAKMFDPFYTTKPVGEGTGMGLSVVFGIVKSHNGNMEVDSVQEQGTSFRIFLPLVDGETPSQPEHDENDAAGNERVLFVDDEEMIVELGRDMLSSLGYSVSMQMRPDRALEVFTRDPSAFDVLVTDQSMPTMTGIELARAVKRIRSDIPVVLCTGYSKQIQPGQPLPEEVDRLVLKPLRKKELGKAVREALQQTD
jgi:PAS domain S-box-containing protein